MRTSLVAMSLALAALVPAQNPPVDLSQWTEEHLNGTGPWTVDAPRLFASSTNAAITDVSVLHSDFDVTLLEFRMSIDPAGGDDDLAGFVVGWQPGDSASATADYLLVDWKKTTQSYGNWGVANAGLAVSHVQGAFTRGTGGSPIDLWSHTGVCTELARGTRFGQTGWEYGRQYHFRVLYLPGPSGSLDVWIDEQQEFHVSGAFSSGRFGCYNFSQSRTGFQFPSQGAFTDYGNGCAGSAGTPNLFAPEEPLVGASCPIIVGNLSPSATAILMLGLSRQSWQSLPLPIDLSPLGASGCLLHTSADVFLPITNFQGTAYFRLPIPPTALPSTQPRLFLQALALDPPANRLGLVASNATAVTIGIR